MVGRPCAQIHGTSRSGRKRRSLYISFLSSAVPIMIAVRQAREASIATTLDGRRILFTPKVPGTGASSAPASIRETSSCTSAVRDRKGGGGESAVGLSAE